MTHSVDTPTSLYRSIATYVIGLMVAIVGFAAVDAYSENRQRVREIQDIEKDVTVLMADQSRGERFTRADAEAMGRKQEEADRRQDDRMNRIQDQVTELRSMFDAFQGLTTAKLDYIIESLDEMKASVKEGRSTP